MSKLLLLEDDLSLINGLSFAFQKAGHEPDIARTLRDAETLWREGVYDLLILDVSLPDGSGFEFCKQVRQTSQVPIIFLTASDTETSIITGLDMGGIECNEEGAMYHLFHEVNALVTIADAHADSERQAKEFLRRTISDISHQLKTPIAALNVTVSFSRRRRTPPPSRNSRPSRNRNWTELNHWCKAC